MFSRLRWGSDLWLLIFPNIFWWNWRFQTCISWKDRIFKNAFSGLENWIVSGSYFPGPVWKDWKFQDGILKVGDLELFTEFSDYIPCVEGLKLSRNHFLDVDTLNIPRKDFPSLERLTISRNFFQGVDRLNILRSHFQSVELFSICRLKISKTILGYGEILVRIPKFQTHN